VLEGVRRVVYRLPEAVKTIAEDRTIFLGRG